MPTFKTSKIFLDRELVAEQLRSVRQAKGIKLSTVGAELKISLKYLRALENGDYDLLPSGVYVLNFLRSYGEYLGLDFAKLKENFLAEKEIYQSETQSNLFARQVVNKKYFLAIPRFIKSFLIFLVGFACLFYLIFLLRNIFADPHLEIFSPLDNLVTNQGQILVNGKTDPETEVLINNSQIVVDKDGNFSKEVSLRPGVNIIIITAKHGSRSQVQVSREALYQISETEH